MGRSQFHSGGSTLRDPFCAQACGFDFLLCKFSFRQLLVYGCSVELIRAQDKCSLQSGKEESSDCNKEEEGDSSPGPFQGNQVKFLK
jgi:hypothetical protein